MRQGGKCALSGKKFRPGETPEFDHVVRLADGGENRESNIQAIMRASHKEKSKAEAKAAAPVKKRAMTHLDIKDKPKAPPLTSRNDLARPKTESKITQDAKPITGRLPLPPRTGGIRFKDKP